ncbi:RHS repeat-associated core domain-containing protein [Catenuloplanes japonicus]|uniref:RHS repeat-associated core domain-containing protein n=1 Tax=Catenuloplanes japonicus TaxID=33876 RepID=UPI0038B8BC6B
MAKGRPSTSTRYSNGNAYTSAITSYDNGYRPLSTTVTVPAAEGALAGTYTNQFTYKPDGSPNTVVTAAVAGASVGGLPLETVQYGYDNAGNTTTLASGAGSYVSGTTFTFDGLVAQQVLGSTANKRLRVSNAYDAATRRLTNRQIDTENATTANVWDDRFTTEYRYDQTGNVTGIGGKTSGARDQVECYSYDYLRRLTQAWTEADWGCATPQRAGTDPYRLSWSYDKTGNRTTQTVHGASATTTDTYVYPAAGGPRPHAVSSIGADTFTYDNAGNTTGRTVGGVSQTLTWDAEGRLATATQGTDQHGYVYDAAGNRLLRRTPGAVTLYLPDGTELTLATATGQVDGTRYYAHNGETVGVRTITGLTRQTADHHGTSSVSATADNVVTRRRSLPFGEPRGTDPAWAGDKGFVGGTKDPTGLVHLGAREYDARTGRFISQDPVIDVHDPQQMNGYAYSNNSPATFSDPDGLRSTDVVTKRVVKKATATIAKKAAAKPVAKIGTKKTGGKIGTKKTAATPVKKKVGGSIAKKSTTGSGKINTSAPKTKLVSNPTPQPPGTIFNCNAPNSCNIYQCNVPGACIINQSPGGQDSGEKKDPQREALDKAISRGLDYGEAGTFIGAGVACFITLPIGCTGAPIGMAVGFLAGWQAGTWSQALSDVQDWWKARQNQPQLRWVDPTP